LRFRFELPRPLERCLLGSRGAEVEESRSTRLDCGVFPPPDFLPPDFPPPDDRLRDREREPDEDPLFDLDELELLLLLLRDPDLRWGILPSPPR
jgi:hypothetical protein